jgi:hypothetical protein
MKFTLPLLSLLLPAAAAPVFTAKTIDDKISIGYGLAIGDVDGDRKPDILLADAKEIVWYRNPGWEKSVIAKNLTPRDNVCIAARDLDGDGKVEIAVGAQWNPGETNNEAESGAVFYLMRPEKDGEMWKPVKLPHEPTTHRMHWVQTAGGASTDGVPAARHFALVVLPLHGRGNVNGAGAGVKVTALHFPESPANPAAWKSHVFDDSLHITHNFDLWALYGNDMVLIASKEGLVMAQLSPSGWHDTRRLEFTDSGDGPRFAGAGEVRYGPRLPDGTAYDAVTCIEPFHGPNLVLYSRDDKTRTTQRRVLDTTFNQGHALACGHVLSNDGREQIVAGWREPNKDKQFGIKVYREENGAWKSDWVCEPNSMACEDLKLADLDGDGRPEIIAAGRSTKNVVIYKAP